MSKHQPDSGGSIHNSAPRPVVVNIDNMEMSRAGISVVLARKHPELDVTEYRFDEALAREDWNGVDYVIIDLAEPNREDQLGEEYPSIEVVHHIRRATRARGPWIVVITGETAAHDEPLVMRRLQEAHADYFLLRGDLERRLDEVFEVGGPAMDRLPTALVQDLSVGVSAKTWLEGVIRTARSSEILRSRRVGGAAHGLKVGVAEANHLVGVEKKNRGFTQKLPQRWQIEEVFKRATRLPRGWSSGR